MLFVRKIELKLDLLITTAIIADGSDYVGGSYTVTFGSEPNAVSCATIGIVVDGVFEDIENFDTNLLPPGTGNVVVGPQDTTTVLIDDLGIVVSLIILTGVYSDY